jgi:hypothetical protein
MPTIFAVKDILSILSELIHLRKPSLLLLLARPFVASQFDPEVGDNMILRKAGTLTD